MNLIEEKKKNAMRIYTTDEVSQILSITRRTLYNYIKAGEIECFKMGRYWRITEDSLKRFTEKGDIPAYSGRTRKK